MDTMGQNKEYQQGINGPIYQRANQNIYGPVLKVSDDEIVSSGLTTPDSFYEIARNTESGEITTYTSRPRPDAVFSAAVENKFKIYASNRITNPGRHTPPAEAIELPHLPYGVPFKGEENPGKFHAKLFQGVLRQSKAKMAGVFTSNLSESNLSKNVINLHLVAKNASIVQQQAKNFAAIQNKQPLYSQKDVLIVSPQDRNTAKRRINYVFNTSISKEEAKDSELTLSSASLTSSFTVGLVMSHLKKGGTVNITESGELKGSHPVSPDVKKAYDKVLDQVETMGSTLPGTLNIGEGGKIESHTNVILYGNNKLNKFVNMISSFRSSANALDKVVGTEGGLLFENKAAYDKYYKTIKENYTWKTVDKVNINAFQTGFIGYVNNLYTLSSKESPLGEQVLIAAQASRLTRDVYEKSGVNLSSSLSTGILTSSLLAYQQVKENKSLYDKTNNYYQKINPEDYQVLSSIQRGWFENKTWGEAWGQLGDRGVIDTSIIKSSQSLNNLISGYVGQTSEEISRRFMFGYRLKPFREESTTIADLSRNFIDFNNNMIANMIGFQIFTTGGSIITSAAFSAVSSYTERLMSDPSRSVRHRVGSISNFIVSSMGTAGYLLRTFSANAFGSYMSPILHAVDSLTGMVGTEGSLQRALERGMLAAESPHNSLAKATKLAMTSANLATSKNILFSPFRIYNEGSAVINRAAGYVWAHAKRGKLGKGLKTVWGFAINGVDRKILASNPHLFGYKKNLWAISGLMVFAGWGLNALTSYLGKTLGGTDSYLVDRANAILEKSARGTGLHPVQVQRTANANFKATGNTFVDGVMNVLAATVFNPIKVLAQNMYDSFTKKVKPKVLGSNIIYQGRELEQAQMAAAMGNYRLAEYYLMSSAGGQLIYEKDLFKADTWKSWNVQVTSAPTLGTATWGMSQHSGAGDRGGFGYNFAPREVQEFGFSLQGPVYLAIGVSVNMPFQMYSQMDYKDALRLKYTKQPWTFTYKPGTNVANAIGAVTFLAAANMTWHTTKSIAADILEKHVVTHAARNKRPNVEAVSRAFSNVLRDSLASSDHRYIYNQSYAGKHAGAKVNFIKPMSPLKAAIRIVSIPVTLPVHAVVTAFNTVMTGFNYYFGGYGHKLFGGYHAARNDLSGFLSGVNDTKLDQLKRLIGSEATGANRHFTTNYRRHEVHAELVRISGGAVYSKEEDFAKTFGLDGSTPAEKAVSKRAFAAYRRLSKPVLDVGSIFAAHGENTNRFSVAGGKILKFVLPAASFVFVAGSVALSMQAQENTYQKKSVESNMAYGLASTASNWVASMALANRADTYKNRHSLMYAMAESIPYDTAPEIFRGVLAYARAGLHLLDYQGVFRNLRMVVTGVASEVLYGIAGFKMDDFKFDPATEMYKLKGGKFATPGVANTVISWATGLIAGFDGSKYGSMETHPYLASGPFGIVQKKIDKDTYAWEGQFVQLSPMMFLNAGFAQQLINRKSATSRERQESKYIQMTVYAPFGLRQNMRDNPIRSSKMYKDDITGDASTWGIRAELLRRSTLFHSVKHMDAMDFIFVPGLITHQKNPKFGYRMGSRVFRDSNTREEANFQKIMEYYSQDVVAKNKDAMESLSGDDSQLEYMQGMQDARTATDYFNRAYFSPLTTNYNILGNPQIQAAMATVSIFGGVALLGAWFDPNLFAGKFLDSFKQRFFKSNSLEAAKRLQSMRASTLHIKTLRIANTSELIGKEMEVLAIGAGHTEELYVKGENYHKVAGTVANAANTAGDGPGLNEFRRYMWESGEFSEGPLNGARRNLNRISGLRSMLLRTGSVGVSYGELNRIHQVLSNLQSGADEMLSDMGGLLNPKDVTEIRGRLDRLKEATAKLEKFKTGIIQSVAGDRRAFTQLLMNSSINLSDLVLDNENIKMGQLFNDIMENMLGHDNSSIKKLDEILVTALKDGKVIQSLGPTHGAAPFVGHGFANLMRQLGVSKQGFREAHKLATYVEIEGVGQKDKSVDGKLVKPGWRQRAQLDFENAVLSNVVEAVMEEDPDSLKALLSDNDFVAELVDNAPETDRVRALEQRLQSVMDAEKYEKIVGSRLQQIKKSAKIETRIKRFTEGLSKLKPLASLAGTAMKTWQFWGLVVDPLNNLAYLKGQTETKDLNVSEKNYAYSELSKETNRFWSGISGFFGGYVLENSLNIINFFRTSAGLGALFAGGTGLVASLPAIATFVLGMAGGIAISWGLEKLWNGMKSDSDHIENGKKIAKDNYVGNFVSSWWKGSISLNEFLDTKSKELSSKEMRNELSFFEMIGNALLKSPLRGAVDVIYKEDKNPGMLLPQLSYKLQGGSPSLDSRSHGAFLDKSVFFVGNELDYGLSFMIPNQNLLPFQDSEGYTHENIHSSIFGYLPAAKQVSANKDGSDALGPTWLRGEYRSHMFHPTNLVQSISMQAEMTRRSDLMIQVMMNLTSQTVNMNKIIRYSSAYDPRSGKGMEPGTYLVSVIDPTKFGMGFAQPLSNLPKVVNPNTRQSEQKAQQSRAYSGVIPPVKPVKATPASEAKQHVVTQVAKGIEKKQKEILDKKQKVNDKKDKKVGIVVPAGAPAKLASHELHSDTYISQSRHEQFGHREIASGNGQFVLPSYKTFDPNDVALMAQADTFDVGTDIMHHDTIC